ncbi:hypothetical protein O3G_MSEX002592 [Manduca sexta]|nr:hypothetical protein O3G_MSEX002592 [Manduca sexta]KAG6442957.1 hypothetical protein O3G_MSEX002592 [Manduca sexta]
MVINGTCRATGKCPQGTRVTTEGLCPYQENRGIQCCHTSTAKLVPQRTCLLKGGECMEPGMRCPEILTIEGTDCARNSICCVLIR